MNDLAAEGVALSVVAQLVQVVAPGLRGPGRVPAAQGRAVALRVEPLSKAQRLAPVGQPSLTPHGQAGGTGWIDGSGPFPYPGTAGPVSFTLRVHEARLANGPACRSLRCAPLGAAPARSPPRSPAMPVAGPLNAGVQRSARSGFAVVQPAISGFAAAQPAISNSTAAPVARLRLPWWHVGRRAAAARESSVGCAATAAPVKLAQRPRRCAARGGGGSPCASRPTALPPAAPPSNCEGDLWGDLQAVGRETGSLLRLRGTPPIPNPFP